MFPPRSKTEGSSARDTLPIWTSFARPETARATSSQGSRSRERERTEILSLKVGFNKVFGYYLEVTKANLDKVPDDYVRKQTLANAERYFTPELKEWEERVFDAEDRMEKLEAGLFSDVRVRVAAEVSRIQEAGSRAARLDVLSTLAHVAERRGYVRPEVHTGVRGGHSCGSAPGGRNDDAHRIVHPERHGFGRGPPHRGAYRSQHGGEIDPAPPGRAHPPDGAGRILRSRGPGTPSDL